MKKLAPLAVLVAIAAVAVYLTLRQEGSVEDHRNAVSPQTHESRSPSSSPAKLPEVSLPELRYGYRQGDHLVFDMAYHLDMRIQPKGSSQDNSFSLDLSGSLHQRIYRADGEKICAGYQVENPRVEIAGADASVLTDFRACFAEEVCIVFDYRGVIEEWLFPRSMRADLAQNFKGILLHTQLVLPEKFQESRQGSAETDLNGNYLADYRIHDTPPVLKIERKKLHYLQSELREMYRFPTSEATFSFVAAEGYWTSLVSLQRVQVETMNIVSRGEEEMRLKLTTRGNEERLAAAFVSRRADMVSQPSRGIQVDAEKRRWQRILGDSDWASLSEELAALQKQEDARQRNEVFRKVIALMELHPEAIDEITNAINNAAGADANVFTLLDALSKVSHPQAQKALAKIIENKQDDEEILGRAIISLGSTPAPGEESIALLERFHETSNKPEIHDAVSLALGSMASKVDNPARAAVIAERLEKSLQRAATSDEKRVVLEALGNAGSESSLVHIRNFVEDGDDTIRACAMSALRSIPGAQCDNLLAQALLTENSSLVRNQILDSMQYRQPCREIYAALTVSLTSERDEDMRIKQATLLWSMRRQFPQAAELVRRQAHEDPSPKVKNSLEMLMLSSQNR